MSGALEERLADLAASLAGVRDMIEGRVASPDPPAWCADRGWTEFLLGLSEEQVRRCESLGFADAAPDLPGAPQSLLALASEVRRLTTLPPPPAVEARPLRAADARKIQQVAALVRLCRERFAGCQRLVDVGAGRGHLTRELAEALGVPSLGIERNPDRVARASELNAERGHGPRFVARELDEAALTFAPGDLAVGLHACGALGDAVVRSAARDGVDLLLVNCCLQHVPGSEREALSVQGRSLGLTFRRDVLGLTNLIAGRRLIEGNTYERVMVERTTRYALRLLLRERGLDLPPGEEMRGLHRRHVRRGLASLAERALARRELAPTSPEEVRALEERAEVDYARIRRLSAPRAMLGRALEMAVVLDRARLLEEAGHQVSVELVFDLDQSPRNLGVLASTDAGH